jgi:Ca2+-binding EF-hand superfamily protein
VVAGVFLGQSSPEEKMKVLFEHYDKEMKGNITVEQFRTMLDDIFTLCIDVLPKMAVGTGY